MRKVRVEKRHNDVVNRLQKTKEEKFPDLRAEREQRDHKEAVEKRKKIQQEKQREKEEIRKRKEQAELRSVKNIFSFQLLDYLLVLINFPIFKGFRNVQI